MSSETVLVIDFGGQYTQLIARRIRELNVYCEILPYNTAISEIKEKSPAALIFSGGAASVYGDGAPDCSMEVYDLGVPILGICYGMQLMAKHLGGEVLASDKHEYGKTEVRVENETPLFAGVPEEMTVWMSHKDQVKLSPPGFTTDAASDNTIVSSMSNQEKKLYAVQFHPEVIHTPHGMEMLKNFLYGTCKLSGNWTMESFIEKTTLKIQEEVGAGKQVVCGLSGGVDSSVAAVLVHKAIGDRLTCIYVDHGMMRKGESTKVVETFGKKFQMNLIHVDARERFLNKLAGVLDPEKKRKIIGNEFIRVFEEEAARLGEIDYLVQGTLYTDVIESGTATAAVIKSHHNVGGLPEDMEFKLIEPLNQLFKDEARKVGEELNMPTEIVWRQPFPGPGLAIRVLGAITEAKLDILREADAIVQEEIKSAGLYREIWQAFAILPDIKSVGVQGDERTYDYAVALRAVTSNDGMTADWARIPYDVLEKISSRIVNEVSKINRVVYDITSKPPSTIEWE